MDGDGNGRPDISEFCYLMASKMKDSEIEEEFIEVCKVFDRDDSGFISGAGQFSQDCQTNR